MVHLFASEVRQLLHNKFVVVLGDSIQRTVYKDLVLLLQKDSLLTYHQLKEKGELSFEHDKLLVGGQKNQMNNGTHYREVRQFCSGHHLVRFYFITRVYSDYMEDILEELRTDSYTPDVLIMNSCLWDLSRYGKNPWKSYRQNLESLFQRLDETLPESCLRVWNTAMPLGQHITGSFLPRDQPLCTASLHKDVVEANFYSFTAAHRHRFDVLDLHFHFRHSQQFRQIDGVHWNEFAHRHLSQLLLAHVADAWEVELPNRRPGYQWNKRIRGRNGKAAERQPHASRYPQAQPPSLSPPVPLLSCRPSLLLRPPTPPQAPAPVSFPFQRRSPMPLLREMPQFPPYAQDSYFCSAQPPPSEQFSDCFHLDDPLPPQTEFSMEGNLMYNPQSPLPLFRTPYCRQRAPVVHRGFSRCEPRGPYIQWRQRLRPSKRPRSRNNSARH